MLKQRFSVLNTPFEYSINIQTELLYACTAVHNFIVYHKGVDEALEAEIKAAREDEENEKSPIEEKISTQTEEAKKIDKLRDKITEDMWRQYQFYLEISNRYS